MILNDRQIIELCKRGMITPFLPQSEGQISYGTSSFGYDIRVGNKFKVFTPVYSTVVDPLVFDSSAFVDITGDFIIIPPNSFALAQSLEHFSIPEDVLVICLGKSTYARCGIVVNATPLEPGWRGVLTIEISNTTPLPAKIYANQGIAQLLFFRGERPDRVYFEKGKAKYQFQTGITLPR